MRPFGSTALERWVPVPPRPMRQQLVRDTHEALGHVGRTKLVESLLTSWWWEGIREDCARCVRECPECAVDSAGRGMASTQPAMAQRPGGPFQGWSIDLAGPFPPDEDGNRWLAVAVDVFTKWVEAVPLQTKHAFVTASWFYTEVMARWGRPAFIRCDHGAEWEGEFRQQCRRMGIVVRQGAVGNSRANGQAERMIRSIKDVVRRFLTREKTAFWSDALPYCLMAARLTPAASHGFPPFTVVTGTTPVLPTQLPGLADAPDDPTPDSEEQFVEELFGLASRIREDTKERLEKRDRLTRAALRRRSMAGEYPTTMFHFRVGQLVLRRARHLGKLSPKAEGPYRVVAVKGLLGQRVAIAPEGAGSKRRRDMLEVHASQLAPYLGVYRDPDVILEDEEGEDGQGLDLEATPPRRGRRRLRAVSREPGSPGQARGAVTPSAGRGRDRSREGRGSSMGA